MSIRPAVNLLIVVALAMIGESTSFKFKDINRWDTATNLNPHHHYQLHGGGSGGCTGGGPVGSCIDQAEEEMLDSESSRRVLGRTRYISYDAMRANNVPCQIRGGTYYNCQPPNQANVYQRACTAATSCARVSSPATI
ncbi:hypothetical protein LguiB_004970 [Lonicera macranthoides]